MAEETNGQSEARAPTPSALDAFVPHPDVRQRHETTVHAPADFVFDVARHFDIQSISLVRAILWLRARLLHAKASKPEDSIESCCGEVAPAALDRRKAFGDES